MDAQTFGQVVPGSTSVEGPLVVTERGLVLFPSVICVIYWMFLSYLQLNC